MPPELADGHLDLVTLMFNYHDLGHLGVDRDSFPIKELAAVGFELQVEANFLRNSNDPRDHNTPDPPQPKDKFVLKFVKP